MFKKCRENQCLNREMIDFINRQLSLLKELSNKASELAAEVVADQILQCVALVEKRIVFALDEKPNEQFHDYVSDFYEDKLQKMRRELSNQLQVSKRLQNKLSQLEQTLKISQQSSLRNRSYDMSTVQQNLTLKNELLHSQRLIADNQQIMEAQNNLINELKVCVVRAEERQREGRARFQQKAKALDQALNNKKKRTLQLMKQFQVQSKRMDRQFRQVQLQNISLVQQKDALQSEVILKSQEIKLLSKKIYDQNMLIGKYERELEFHSGVIEEEKVGMNRTFDENKMLKERMRQLEREYEKRISIKSKQIKQLEQRILQLVSNNKQLQSLNQKNTILCERSNSQLKQKREQVSKLEGQCVEFENKVRQLEKQSKRLERKSKEHALRLKETEQTVLEKEQEIKEYKETITRIKKDLEKCQISFERQKQLIRKDIEAEFVRLVNLNKQMLSAIEKTEAESAQLKGEVDQLSSKNTALLSNIEQLSESFEEAKRMTNSIEQEKHDLTFIKEQLQLKLKNSQRRCQELSRQIEQHDELVREQGKFQQIQQQSLKLIKEKQNQIEKYKRIISQQSTKKLGAETESIRQMKEELCKKEFTIKQLNAKLNEVQNELRDLHRRYQHEKESMTMQIRDMERIIQDNFDHSNGSNRLLDSALI